MTFYYLWKKELGSGCTYIYTYLLQYLLIFTPYIKADCAIAASRFVKDMHAYIPNWPSMSSVKALSSSLPSHAPSKAGASVPDPCPFISVYRPIKPRTVAQTDDGRGFMMHLLPDKKRHPMVWYRRNIDILSLLSIAMLITGTRHVQTTRSSKYKTQRRLFSPAQS